MSLLYFFFNTEGSAVKIGKSGNPHLRASQLPVPIDLGRSFEIEFTSGSAASVERLLHYLFRDHKVTMPPGDGHTEWFRADALPDILRFLERERERLGSHVVRALPVASATLPQALEKRDNRKEAARLRLEDRQARYLAELASCAEHNAKVTEWIQQTFDELRAADILVGIVAPPSGAPQSDAEVYLQGERRKWALDRLYPGELSTLRNPNGFTRVLTGSFYASDFRFARVSISRRFAASSLDPAFGERWPQAETIRSYFHARTATPGSPQETALLDLGRRLDRSESGLLNAFHSVGT